MTRGVLIDCFAGSGEYDGDKVPGIGRAAVYEHILKTTPRKLYGASLVTLIRG
jgi:hypothetical protein